MQVDWEGVMPAVTTKFTEDDTLDLRMFRKNIDAQVDAGVSGIILGVPWARRVHCLMMREER